MPAVSGNGKNGTWVKQEFVIETNDSQYPKKVCITAWGEKAEQVSALNIGDEVKVAINIESREYNDRWYTDVKAWNIEVLQQEYAQASRPSGEGRSPSIEHEPAPFVDADDLPF